MSALTALPDSPIRRAGPPALIAAALLFGVLSVGYAWIVARHLRNAARETSRLLGEGFAGLNDPREGAASDALLTLADGGRHLGIPLAVTDTAGGSAARGKAPPPTPSPPSPQKPGTWAFGSPSPTPRGGSPRSPMRRSVRTPTARRS